MALGKAGYVRVVWSKGLVHGLGGGFAFIIRPDRLIGSKKFTRRTESFELRELISQDPKMTRSFLQLAVSMPPGLRKIKDPEELRRLLANHVDEQIRANVPDDDPRMKEIAEALRLVQDPSAEKGVKVIPLDAPAVRTFQDEELRHAIEQAAQEIGAQGEGAQADVRLDLSSLMNGRENQMKREKTLLALEMAKRFEFPRDEIQSIEVTPPGPSGPGRIVIRTTRDEQNVKVSDELATGEGATFDTLVTWLEEFAPGQLTKMG
ncbi:MAG: hypothetical protein E6K12_09070 [Methanobacteriota archaeon]|nr:MAG: hypothetical protein E6K12_09070 [Euryarchaeota archaeon]